MFNFALIKELADVSGGIWCGQLWPLEDGYSRKYHFVGGNFSEPTTPVIFGVYV
jgi:hypothetical protein